MANDGMFAQPVGGGMFRDGGSPPNDPAAPPIDSDGTPLQETLVVVYPSPGHMRVARAIRHPQSGRVEMQEEYREPTPLEVQLLAQQGVTVGQGSMVMSGPGVSGLPQMGDAGNPPNGTAAAGGTGGTSWWKIGAALAAGAAGLWAVNRWVVPKVTGLISNGGDVEDDDDGDDGADDGDDGDDA